MIKISEKENEFSFEWLKHLVCKYGSEKVYLHQDENKINYIIVETTDENRFNGISSKFSESKSLSTNELESVPF